LIESEMNRFFMYANHKKYMLGVYPLS